MKRVLFIDVRNTARGPIAEAWFNQLALGWGRASSCGTMPAPQFDMLAVQVMAEVGAPIRPHLPRAINQQMLSRANRIVIMGHDVPARAFPNATVWNFPDPTGEMLETYRVLRNDILASVHDLMNTMRPIVPAPAPRPFATDKINTEDSEKMPIALGVYHNLADLHVLYTREKSPRFKGYVDEESDDPDTEKNSPGDRLSDSDDDFEIVE